MAGDLRIPESPAVFVSPAAVQLPLWTGVPPLPQKVTYLKRKSYFPYARIILQKVTANEKFIYNAGHNL